MDQNNIIECGGFYFIHNFDSGNLGHVERVPTELIVPSVNSKTNATETPDYEFNLWTRPDCAGTEFENGNRTWFYFGMQATEAGVLVRLNLINLNKQGKMYNQGMAPVTRTLPGKPQWERIKDRPVHSTDDNTFTLSFKYRTPDNMKATTFFAFTYPFSFAELQIALNSIDLKMLPLTPPQSPDDIYYCRECLIYSLEGRRTDLLTISSYHGITTEREERLKNLFPENNDRPFKFTNKKVIFISARVHPGETPSSFVFNGFLNLLLNRNDPIAIALRKLYVFKLIPFLNPDGVARGHYRTDTRGVNLNRVYLNPSLVYHPTVYASRALIRYYHYGCEKEDILDESKSFTSRSIQNIGESVEIFETKKPREKKSSSSSFKGNEICKREKSGKPTLAKSSTTIKQPSIASENSKSGEINADQNAIVQKRLVETNAQDKPTKLSVNNKSSTKPSREANKRNIKTLSGEAAHLAEQVYDMKLQERPSQTSESSSKTNLEETPSLLNDSTLRTCLGSNVHLSTSEELNFQGNNPLRPLRDTLKNSISLLMESNSSHAEDISPVGQDSSKVKMSWCRDCRLAVSKLENTMPGISNMVPGYNLTMSRQQSPSHQTFENINEYRMHQLQQIDEYDLQSLDNSATDTQKEKDDTIYFCTNCFKRYIINELNEEVKLNDVVSTQSMGVSAGDSGDVRTESESTERPTDSTGDSLPSPINQPTEKPKSTTRQNKKKNNPPTPSPPVVNNANVIKVTPLKEPESGLYLYIDLHGHASKKGIFMYGNHFDELESCVECMLLPRIMSLNNLHFHFSSCNFTERNMYLKDRRDGMSREGSGRVAVFKATGLVRCYTLECNYNTGRLVNVLPPPAREGAPLHTPLPAAAPLPPKYTPHIFEEVGRSLGASILDLTGQHPNSRIPCSEHRNLAAVRDWLRAHTRTTRPQLTTTSRLRPKPSSPTRLPIYARSKGKVTEERKENTYVGVKPEPPPLAPPVAMKFSKQNEPVKSVSRTRYLSENEPKPKTLSTKRRNILAVRKPNASKTTVGGVVKPKLSRRSVDDGESPRASVTTAKMGKRGFTRVRATRTTKCPRALASSSSDDLTGGQWEDVPGGTALGNTTLGAKRRPYPAPPPPLLKKIRLKTAL